MEIKNLTTHSFQNLNFKLTDPGIYGIIGRNGSGKSTFFTALNGEMKFQGEINKIGKVVYVPNLEIFDSNLSGEDYVQFLSDEERYRAEQLIPYFQASRFFNKQIKTYSLGMKEILAFIYSLSVKSDVIIIDELMNGLDNTMRESAYKLLKDVGKTKTILLTSHILEEVEKYCDQVYFLSYNSLALVSDFEEAKKLIWENEVFI